MLGKQATPRAVQFRNVEPTIIVTTFMALATGVITTWLASRQRERADRRLDAERQALRQSDRVHERQFNRIEELAAALTELYFENQSLSQEMLTRGEKALQHAQLYLVPAELAQRVRSILNSYISVHTLRESQPELAFQFLSNIKKEHQPLLADLRRLVGVLPSLEQSALPTPAKRALASADRPALPAAAKKPLSGAD
jgi:hypothetical protein